MNDVTDGVDGRKAGGRSIRFVSVSALPNSSIMIRTRRSCIASFLCEKRATVITVR